MNTDTMQLVYGFASAAFIIGACILIIEYEVEHDVSEGKQMATVFCLPMLLWAAVLTGYVWLFG